MFANVVAVGVVCGAGGAAPLLVVAVPESGGNVPLPLAVVGEERRVAAALLLRWLLSAPRTPSPLLDPPTAPAVAASSEAEASFP